MVAEPNDQEERLAEEERVTRYNMQMSEAILTCEDIESATDAIFDVFTVNDYTNPRIVLDSGATSSVAGGNWVIQRMGKQTLMESRNINRKFRFGDARTASSRGKLRSQSHFKE